MTSLTSNVRASARVRPPTEKSAARVLGWTLVPLVLLAAWEAGAAAVAQPWLFPRFTTVAARMLSPAADLYRQGSLLSNTLVSLARVAVGFSVAAVAGVGLALVLGVFRTPRGLLEPLLEILRPLSPIAWLPFAIAVFKLRTVGDLFGLGYTRTVLDQLQLGMIFVIFWGGFFPIFVSSLDGVLRVRRDYLLLARVLGAGRLRSFTSVYLPAALPSVLTGARLGVGNSWRVIIAAEMLPGSAGGIGYLLMYAADQSAMDVVLAAMIVIGAVGASLSFGMRGLTRTFVRWQGKEG